MVVVVVVCMCVFEGFYVVFVIHVVCIIIFYEIYKLHFYLLTDSWLSNSDKTVDWLIPSKFTRPF